MRPTSKQIADIRNFLLTLLAGIGLMAITFAPLMLMN
jgi:hypothetical protein